MFPCIVMTPPSHDSPIQTIQVQRILVNIGSPTNILFNDCLPKNEPPLEGYGNNTRSDKPLRKMI